MKAAIYARYSSENQDIGSIDAQIRAIQDYALKNGHEIVKVYTDEARSATSDDRPEFLKMIKESAFGIFEVIIVHKLDRFSRDRYDSSFYKRQLKKNGIRLISVLENLDDSPESIILESVLEGMAEYYSRNLAREVMKGMKENALKCKPNGGTPALGYDIVNGSYVINESEAQIIKYIFNRYKDNAGYKTIIRELKERGWKTKRGMDFTQSSIHDILKNEKYIGNYIFNKQAPRIGGKRNKHKSKSEDEIIRVPGGIPRIIDDEIFYAIRERMTSRANGSNKAKQIYLLSGKAICGKCGASMIGHTSHNKGYDYHSYVCGKRYRSKGCDLKSINRINIENMVIFDLENKIFNPKSIRALLKKLVDLYNQSKDDDKTDLKLFEKKIKDIDKKIGNIMRAIEDGMYSPSMKENLSNLENQKNELNKMINEIIIKNSSNILNEKLIEQYLLRDMEKFNNREDLKEIINTYVDKVIVTDDDIETILKVVHLNGAGKPYTIKCTTSLLNYRSK